MKRLILAAALALLAAASTAALAGPPHGKGHGHGPGPGFVPPGLAKKAWKRGDRIDVVYLQPRYYVEDYRAYRLAPPPRGHRWVVVDGRYVLVAVATGIIADILLHH